MEAGGEVNDEEMSEPNQAQPEVHQTASFAGSDAVDQQMEEDESQQEESGGRYESE